MAPDLLSALGGLTHLTALRLCSLDSHSLYGPQDDPQRLHALTASSRLAALHLTAGRGGAGLALRPGCMQALFPPGSSVPSLTELLLDDPYVDERAAVAWALPCLEARDILTIAAACPNLCSLGVVNVLQQGEDLAPLLQLPGSCRALRVGGAAFGDNPGVQVRSAWCLVVKGWAARIPV